MNALALINNTEQAQEIEYKSINDLLPPKLNSFYTYSGSLTTPPCYQVVNWVVMTDRLAMNAKQIEMFRNLYAPPDSNEEGSEQHARLIMPNVRNLQPLNNRTILASFETMGRLEAEYSGPIGSANGLYTVTSGVLICASILIGVAINSIGATSCGRPATLTGGSNTRAAS